MLDLLLEIVHRLLVGIGGVGEFFLHLRRAAWRARLCLRVELAVAEILGELLDFLGGLLEIALLHGLGDLFGRAVAEGLEILQLLLQAVLAAELLAALAASSLGEIVELDGRLGAIEVFLLGELVGAGFDLLEQAFGRL